MYKVGDIVRVIANPSDADDLKGKVGKVIAIDSHDYEEMGVHVRFREWNNGWGDDENEWWISPSELQRLWTEEAVEEVEKSDNELFDEAWEELTALLEENVVTETSSQHVEFSCLNEEYGEVIISHTFSANAPVNAHLALFRRYLLALGYADYEIIARAELSDGDVVEHSSED